MRVTGGWMSKKNLSAVLLAAALPALAGATGTPAVTPPYVAARTERECMDQWRRWIPDPRPRAGTDEGLPPEKMCENSSQLPADGGRCKEIYEAILAAYSNAESSVQKVCALVPKAYAAQCDSQGKCLRGTAEFQQEYATNLSIHEKYVTQLIEEMDRMAKLGLETTEQYANDLKEFKASPDKTQATEKARRHGSGTIADAIEKHDGQDAESVLALLQKVRNSSTITDQELDRVRSPYVFEQLQASATAFDQKRDLEEYARSLRSQQREAQSHATKIGQQSTNMNSMSQSSTPSGLNIPSAASAVASGPVGSTGYPVPQFSGGSAYPEGIEAKLASGPKARASSETASRGSTGNLLDLSIGAGKASAVAAIAPAGSTAGSSAGEVNVSNASVPVKGSLRDELRARLARQRAATGAGKDDGASVGSDKEKAIAAGKKEAAEKEVLAASGEQFDNSRIPAMLLNSENEGAVKDLVNDFERSMSGDRSPASIDAQGGNEILTSESPSLFLRLKEVHERCLKRGCVAKVAKGKM